MKVNDNSAANKPNRVGTPATRGADAGASVRKSGKAGEAASGGSTVTLSGDVGDVERLSSAAQETPEVRPEVVEQVKQELANGDLDDLDPELLAARLLQDMGWFAGSDE